jgi:hypothetical protein
MGDGWVLHPSRTGGRINTGWQTKIRVLQAGVAEEDNTAAEHVEVKTVLGSVFVGDSNGWHRIWG